MDNDGFVNFNDLIQVLANWGVCPDCAEDVDASGTVDFNDVCLLLSGASANRHAAHHKMTADRPSFPVIKRFGQERFFMRPADELRAGANACQQHGSTVTATTPRGTNG